MTYSRGDQLDVIKSLHLKDGDRITINCPFCGGPNKFTVDKSDGRVIWNCYRASCPAKGSYHGKRSISSVRDCLNNQRQKAAPKKVSAIPRIVTLPENYPPAMKYLEEVNSLEAYQSKLIKIRYAPAEKRVLFYNSDGTGAVGRSLSRSNYKWWSYGQLDGGIHVGEGDHAILVEDVPSACAVSRINGYVGVALLGTKITKGIKSTLVTYKNNTLVLDNDASSKAIIEASRLAGCKLRFTKLDLKNLTVEKIKEVLNV
tara:strand:+ start:396 stop:1169 length:774 start_codon:yes stop_codon:yes gene_type:complete